MNAVIRSAFPVGYSSFMNCVVRAAASALRRQAPTLEATPPGGCRSGNGYPDGYPCQPAWSCLP